MRKFPLCVNGRDMNRWTAIISPVSCYNSADFICPLSMQTLDVPKSLNMSSPSEHEIGQIDWNFRYTVRVQVGSLSSLLIATFP